VPEHLPEMCTDTEGGHDIVPASGSSRHYEKLSISLG